MNTKDYRKYPENRSIMSTITARVLREKNQRSIAFYRCNDGIVMRMKTSDGGISFDHLPYEIIAIIMKQRIWQNDAWKERGVAVEFRPEDIEALVKCLRIKPDGLASHLDIMAGMQKAYSAKGWETNAYRGTYERPTLHRLRETS